MCDGMMPGYSDTARHSAPRWRSSRFSVSKVLYPLSPIRSLFQPSNESGGAVGMEGIGPCGPVRLMLDHHWDSLPAPLPLLLLLLPLSLLPRPDRAPKMTVCCLSTQPRVCLRCCAERVRISSAHSAACEQCRCGASAISAGHPPAGTTEP